MTQEDISAIVEARLEKMGVPIFNCSKCGRKIVWLRTKAGKNQPATMNLISHFADCPKAQHFRKKAAAKRAWLGQ